MGTMYWQTLQDFINNHLLRLKLISPEDLNLYRLTDNVQEAVDEVLRFFRVYHSMRYVKQTLVLRLSEPLHSLILDQINSDFRDILVDGQFTLTPALPAERDEPDLLRLPRLAFHFNRRNFGRLRQLIDLVNGGGAGGRS